MAKGYFTAGSRPGAGAQKAPRTSGRRNGGNPPGCLTFISFMAMLGLGLIIFMTVLNILK